MPRSSRPCLVLSPLAHPCRFSVALLVSSTPTPLLLRYSIFLLFTSRPPTAFFFPSVPLVSTTLSLLSSRFARFFPRCSSPFTQCLHRSPSPGTTLDSCLSSIFISRASNPSLLPFSFFLLSPLSTSYLFPFFLSLASSPSLPSHSLSLFLSLVFSFSFFLFRVAISRLCPARREPSPSLSRSLSRVCGTRETIMGRTGWLCPPQDIGCRGEIGNRVYALSVLLVSSVFLQSHPFSLPLHLLFYLCPAFYAIQCSSLSLQCVSLPLALHPARPREPWIRRGRVLYAPPDWRAATPHELFGNLIVSWAKSTRSP